MSLSTACNLAIRAESFAATTAAQVGSFVANDAAPAAASALSKTETVWSQTVPYLKNIALFVVSPLGISLIVLGISVIPLGRAHNAKSIIAKISWCALGILIVGYAGILMANAINPALFPAFLLWA